MKGYIVKGIGGFYYVKTEEGVIECKPRGIFRKQKITPVAGDEVTLETENGAAVIAEIAPRKNVFVRPPVANLDVLFLVASTTQPTPSTLVLDKLSAIAVDKGVQPVIVCTKADLGEVEFLRSAYERSTLPFIAIRYDSGEGLDEVRQWISGRLCAFCGNSGVGKSTLLNALLPEAERETSAISQKLGRGRHTTREVTIFEAFDGRIADTPGACVPGVRALSGPVPVHRLLPPQRKRLCRARRTGRGQALPDPVRQLLRHVRGSQGREGLAAPESIKDKEEIHVTLCDHFGLPGFSGAGRGPAAGRLYHCL